MLRGSNYRPPAVEVRCELIGTEVFHYLELLLELAFDKSLGEFRGKFDEGNRSVAPGVASASFAFTQGDDGRRFETSRKNTVGDGEIEECRKRFS